MFTPEERERVRAELLDSAARDPRIAAAAITGSAAAGREDRWSDVDLAFAVRDADAIPESLADWTARLYSRYGAAHHADIRAGVWIYRAFLLADTLQVDLAFVPASEFRPLAPTFRLVFGAAGEPTPPAPAAPGGLIGLAWLYAVHARSSIARRKLWQAEYMISGVRDQGLALACLRHGLPAVHGRGIDQLPSVAVEPWEATLVRRLETGELSRAFRAALGALLEEIRQSDAEAGGRLEEPFRRLAESNFETTA